jgi:hypothetical protein
MTGFCVSGVERSGSPITALVKLENRRLFLRKLGNGQ